MDRFGRSAIMRAMKILYIHQNFPAQYRHVAGHLARAGGHSQVAIAKTTAGRVGGVRTIHYHIADTAQPSQNPYVLDLETKVHHGEIVRDAMASLKRRGFHVGNLFETAVAAE